MAILRQSTAYTRMFVMIDSSDHVTGKTGLTVTVTLSKAGGAFAAAGGSVTEVSSGWYKLALNTTDTNTLGDLAYHCTSTGADPTDFVDQIGAVVANVISINDAASGIPLDKTLQTVLRGTVTTGGTTTSVPTSALTIAGSAATGVVADQFLGRVVLFDGDTTTQGLRGAAAVISASSASNTPTFTTGTLPYAPASGDTFSIV